MPTPPHSPDQGTLDRFHVSVGNRWLLRDQNFWAGVLNLERNEMCRCATTKSRTCFLDLSFYYDYDNQPPGEATVQDDYGIVTSLGYSF